MGRKKVTIEWLEQVDDGGCGIACLAMVTNKTYAEVRRFAPAWIPDAGVEEADMDEFLAEYGYAVQRLTEWRNFAKKGERRKKNWPPKPWADRHIALVWQTEQDEDAHYIVIDRKGNVYDPADPEYQPCKLDRYHKIDWIAAVIPVNP